MKFNLGLTCAALVVLSLSSIVSTAKADDAFAKWSREGKGLALTTENSKHQLFDTLAGATKAMNPAKSTGALTEWRGKNLQLAPRLFGRYTTPKGRVIPLKNLWVLQASLEHVARRAGLSEELAFELGMRLQREVFRDLGESFEAYLKFCARELGANVKLDDSRMLDIARKVNAYLIVDRRFNIPAFAGYAKQDSRFVYLDSAIPLKSVLKTGRVIDVGYYVLVHEFVEKELIDLWNLPLRPYYRTHQIAQRVEKNAVQADGISWFDYQHRLVAEIAEQVDANPMRAVPADLDLTPYTDPPVAENLDEMKAKMVDPRP